MDFATADMLVSSRGDAALAAAEAEADPSSLGAATRLRRDFEPELAAAALTQAGLRRKAVRKLGDRAQKLLFTPAGLEQATRWDVAAWRARQFAAAGVRRVVDLCCGLGVDALAFAEAGLDVVGVEKDAATATLARVNLGSAGEIRMASAEDVAADLMRPDGTAVFCDPARRTDRGRSWNVSDLSPAWAFVESLLNGTVAAAVKLGPGFPDALIPAGAGAAWVASHGDLVECSLWRGLGFDSGVRAAVLLPAEDSLVAIRGALPDPLDRQIRPGDIVYEPASAVTRAGASGHLAQLVGARPVLPRVAYLVAERHTPTPFAAAFEVRQTMPWKEQILRRWVATEGIGTLEIKVRGLDVDPAALRKRLHLKGRGSATVILTPTNEGPVCLVAQRKA